MDDLLAEFLTETNEFLETVDNDLVKLESDPTDKDTLNNIFRLVHTIKGTCGFLGLPRLQFVAHAGETLLGKFRDGALVATPDTVQLVLESIDRIKEILADLEQTGSEPDGDDSELIGALERAAEGEAVVSAAPAPRPVPEAPKAPEPVAEAVLNDDPTWDADLGRHLKPGEVSLAALEAAFMAAEFEDPLAEPQPAAEPVDRSCCYRTLRGTAGQSGCPRSRVRR
jgi:two-component system, chemotaxis family, sensor kinase CheA